MEGYLKKTGKFGVSKKRWCLLDDATGCFLTAPNQGGKLKVNNDVSQCTCDLIEWRGRTYLRIVDGQKVRHYTSDSVPELSRWRDAFARLQARRAAPSRVDDGESHLLTASKRLQNALFGKAGAAGKSDGDASHPGPTSLVASGEADAGNGDTAALGHAASFSDAHAYPGIAPDSATSDTGTDEEDSASSLCTDFTFASPATLCSSGSEAGGESAGEGEASAGAAAESGARQAARGTVRTPLARVGGSTTTAAARRAQAGPARPGRPHGAAAPERGRSQGAVPAADSTGTAQAAALAPLPYYTPPYIQRFSRIRVYETETKLYMVGSDTSRDTHRILKLDRTTHNPTALADVLSEDPGVYSEAEVQKVLEMVSSGNTSMVRTTTAAALVGFVRFLGEYYMLLLTGTETIGSVCGHRVHAIREHILLPICPQQSHSRFQRFLGNVSLEQQAEEKYKTLFGLVDLTKDFFFSYTLDLTRTTQQNMMRQPAPHSGDIVRCCEEAEQRWNAAHESAPPSHASYAPWGTQLERERAAAATGRSADPAARGTRRPGPGRERAFRGHWAAVVGAAQRAWSPLDWSPKEEYCWNSFLLRDLRDCRVSPQWLLPLVNGSFTQHRGSVFGRTINVTLLARRSRYFAGTRYLKRGINDAGHVANDVELEQIVDDDMDRVSSYVQMRGSIPVRWTQVTSATMPKPPIQVEHMDPSFTPSRRHFADLFARYGSPVLALNLVRQSEKTPRETLIGTQFAHLVRYINAFLPREHAVRHLALDYSAMSKRTRGKPSIMDTLRDIAEESLSLTGFFASRPPLRHRSRLAPPSHHRTLRVSAVLAVEEAAGHSRTAPALQDAIPEDATAAAAGRPAVGNGPWANGPARRDRARTRRNAWWRTDEVDDSDAPAPHHNSLGQYKRQLRGTVPPVSSPHWPGALCQNGVVRTNCVDCLDRTNVAQFVHGVAALGKQLVAIGIGDNDRLRFSNNLTRMLASMYETMGDRVAMQYGGSNAHKRVHAHAGENTVRPSSSKIPELLTSIRRYYSNSFTDGIKQDALNLFLGYYEPRVHFKLLGNQHLWELDGDSPLHNAQPYSNFREADLVAQLKAWWQPPLQRYLASHLPRPSDVRRLRLDRRTASIVRMRFARSMTLAPERFVSPTPHLTELGAAEVAEDEVGYSPQGSTHSGSVAHPPSGGRYRTDSATVEYGELLVGPRGAATHGAESDDERKLQAFPTGLDSGAEGAMPSYALDTEAYAAAWTADSAGWAAPPGATPFDARDGVAGGATHPAPRAGSTHWLHDPGSLTSFDEVLGTAFLVPAVLAEDRSSTRTPRRGGERKQPGWRAPARGSQASGSALSPDSQHWFRDDVRKRLAQEAAREEEERVGGDGVALTGHRRSVSPQEDHPQPAPAPVDGAREGKDGEERRGKTSLHRRRSSPRMRRASAGPRGPGFAAVQQQRQEQQEGRSRRGSIATTAFRHAAEAVGVATARKAGVYGDFTQWRASRAGGGRGEEDEEDEEDEEVYGAEAFVSAGSTHERLRKELEHAGSADDDKEDSPSRRPSASNLAVASAEEMPATRWRAPSPDSWQAPRSSGEEAALVHLALRAAAGPAVSEGARTGQPAGSCFDMIDSQSRVVYESYALLATEPSVLLEDFGSTERTQAAYRRRREEATHVFESLDEAGTGLVPRRDMLAALQVSKVYASTSHEDADSRAHRRVQQAQAFQEEVTGVGSSASDTIGVAEFVDMYCQLLVHRAEGPREYFAAVAARGGAHLSSLLRDLLATERDVADTVRTQVEGGTTSRLQFGEFAGKPYHTPARLLLTLPSTEQTREFAQQVAPYLKPAALAHPAHCRDYALYAGSVPHA